MFYAYEKGWLNLCYGNQNAIRGRKEQNSVKRLLKVVLIFSLTIIAAIIIPFIAAPVIDDIALANYKKEVLSNLELPADTEVIEIVTGCGNTSGTGNHTELYVAILVKTDLTENDWKDYGISALDSGSNKTEPLAMGCIGLSFDLDEEDGFADGYHILEYSKSAPCSMFDLRGH